MVSLRECSLVGLVALMIMTSGCVSGKTAQLLDSYNKAGMKDNVIYFIKGSNYYQDNGGVAASCSDPRAFGNSTFKMECSFKNGFGPAATVHDVAIKIKDGNVVEAIADSNMDMLKS